MSPSQEDNLDYIKRAFLSLVDSKYRKGAEEHSGDLLEVSEEKLVTYAIEEAIDQVVYLLTLRRQLRCKSL